MKIGHCAKCDKLVRGMKDPEFKIIERYPYVHRGTRTLWLCPECQQSLRRWIEEGKDEQSE